MTNGTNAPIFTASIGGWQKWGDSDILIIRTILTNNTLDTISYVTMSCNWEDKYNTDSRQLSVYLESICLKNRPEIRKIPPHAKEERDLPLTCKNGIGGIQHEKFRVGFNFISAGTLSSREVLRDPNFSAHYHSLMESKQNIIWCNAMELK